MDIFHQLHSQGRTIVVVTHSPDVAAHAQRIVRLEFGRMVGDEFNGRRLGMSAKAKES